MLTGLHTVGCSATFLTEHKRICSSIKVASIKFPAEILSSQVTQIDHKDYLSHQIMPVHLMVRYSKTLLMFILPKHLTSMIST